MGEAPHMTYLSGSKVLIHLFNVVGGVQKSSPGSS